MSTAIRLTRVADGVYRYGEYTATRRRYHTPVADVCWVVETPTGKKHECETLREVRELIADEAKGSTG